MGLASWSGANGVHALATLARTQSKTSPTRTFSRALAHSHPSSHPNPLPFCAFRSKKEKRVLDVALPAFRL